MQVNVVFFPYKSTRFHKTKQYNETSGKYLQSEKQFNNYIKVT